jgi:hypothetical protein
MEVGTPCGRGGSAANIPAWAESKNNVSSARGHFLHRVNQETRKIVRKSPAERDDSIRDWLEGAAATSLYIRTRLGDDQLDGPVIPADSWLALFDSD